MPAITHEDGTARVHFQFAGQALTVIYMNSEKLDAGQYGIRSLEANGVAVAAVMGRGYARIARATVQAIGDNGTLKVFLASV